MTGIPPEDRRSLELWNGLEELTPQARAMLAVLNRAFAAHDALAERAVDLEVGGRILWEGSVPWEACTEQHKDHWRGKAKRIADGWGLPTKPVQ